MGELENRPGLTTEVEAYNDELRGLSLEAAAARLAAAVADWRAQVGL